MTTGTATAAGNLPASIPHDVSERMASALADSKSEATIRAYRTAWAGDHSAAELPADPAMIAAYISARATDGAVLRQGRWQSTRMVASYTRNERAGEALRYL